MTKVIYGKVFIVTQPSIMGRESGSLPLGLVGLRKQHFDIEMITTWRFNWSFSVLFPCGIYENMVAKMLAISLV